MGSTFAGHRIEEVAGRGGMAVVYRATHLALARTVALKVIGSSSGTNEGFRERFKRESQVAASIDHPNVIPIYHAGEEDDLLYITMRFVEGTDLGQMIARNGRLEYPLAAKIVSQVAMGLDAAHARGLVHRDVKPANVLIEARDVTHHAYLSDFGLTRHTTTGASLTRAGQWVGTIDFVAPEQIEGKHTDARSDVYALGGVLYQALTGTVPYPLDSDVAKMWAHMHERPRPLREGAPEVPPEFEQAVERAMAKDPQDRYPSAGDLGRAVLAACAGSVETPTESTVAVGEAAPSDPVPSPTSRPTDVRSPAEAPGSPSGQALAKSNQPSRPAGLSSDLPEPAPDAPATSVSAVPEAPPISAPAVPEAPAVRASRSPDGAPERPLDESRPSTQAAPGPPHAPPPDSASRTADEAHSSEITAAPARPVPEERRLTMLVVAVSATAIVVTILALVGKSLLDGDPSVGTSLRVGERPGAVTVGDGSVWVVRPTAGAVFRIDPDSNEPGEPIRVGDMPVGVGFGEGAAWVANSGDDTVSPIVVDTQDPPIFVGDSPRSVTVGEGSVWITNQRDGTVSRINPKTQETIGDPIAVGQLPGGAAFGQGALWVANSGDDTVSRIDPGSNTATGGPIRVRGKPTAVAFGEGAVWVANSGDGTVSRIDPASGQVAGRPVQVGGEPVSIAVGEGAVWVANRGDGTVSRIDP